MKKILVTTMIIVGLLMMTTSCQKKEVAIDEPIKIGHLPLVMSLPTYVAVEKGFFKKQGLTVELSLIPSGTQIIDALMAGRIDANCGSASTGHWFAAQNAPDRFKIFLIYGTTSNTGDNTFVVVTKKGAPIKELKDLKEKTIATFPGATSVSLARIAISTQVDPKEVTITEMPPPNLVPALAAGKIDAFFSPEPFGMIAVSQGIGTYMMKSPLNLLNLKSGVPGGAFSVTTDLLEKRPQAAKRLQAAIEEAVDYIRENEKEVRPILAKYTKLPPPVTMGIPFDSWVKMDEYDPAAGQAYFDLLYNDGAYQQKVDTTALYVK